MRISTTMTTCVVIPPSPCRWESKIDGCKGTVEALQRIVPAIRKRVGKKVRIILRGDGGFAHIVMNRMKACVLKGTELDKASIGQIRLKLFKIAVRIKVSVRRVLLEFASSYPRKKLFGQCFENLARLDEMPA